MQGVTVRTADPGDAGTILELVRALAAFEDLSGAVKCREEDLREALVGPRPALHAVLAEHEGRAIGVATYYFVFSSFRGRKLLFLEDILVADEVRGLGVGYDLMVFTAAQAKESGCEGMRWLVLDWNEHAIGFYERLGASCDAGWVPYSLTGPPFDALAAALKKGSPPGP